MWLYSYQSPWKYRPFRGPFFYIGAIHGTGTNHILLFSGIQISRSVFFVVDPRTISMSKPCGSMLLKLSVILKDLKNLQIHLRSNGVLSSRLNKVHICSSTRFSQAKILRSIFCWVIRHGNKQVIYLFTLVQDLTKPR
ncbi:hypothetical protein Hdeb2414_s0004g00127541 [Helianthus debilis subsp. tardiflorus]